jgi:hypothetical protein
MVLLSKLRTRLTFANVVSVLALFVALGGSSYAAIQVTGKNVKNSSLTGRDVKNSSLTTSDVRNRSLLAQDFKAGQLPAAPQGLPGPTGAKGEKGDQGIQGERGPSEAWAVELTGGSAQVTLPPGEYVAQAVARWHNQTGASVLRECLPGVTFPGNPEPRFGGGTTTVPAGSWGSVASIWAFTVRDEPGGGGGTSVTCGTDTYSGVLIVTRVGSLQ